jgi:hypothetical protein
MRACLYCNEEIPQNKRADSKFCSNSCKARYWEEKKEVEPKVETVTKKQENELANELRGIIDPNVTTSGKAVLDWISKDEEVETEDYKFCKKQVDKFKLEIKKLRIGINECDENINRIQDGNPALLISTTLGGGVLANGKSDGHPLLTLGGAAIGLGAGKLIDVLFFANQREQENEKIKAELEKRKAVCKAKLGHYLTQLKIGENHIKNIKQFEIKTKRMIVLKNNFPELPAPNLIEPSANELIKHNQIDTDATEIQTNDKVISSKELREMNYKILNFESRWKDIFGQPAVVFHLAVHGKPGEGKSTFSIQFAHYLAENFGRVIYVSGEEGFSKTLRDKMMNNKAESEFLFFADCSSFEHIKERVENKFHFIFIDSLDTLRIDATKLRELKDLYPDSAFITISQSTKDGKMRGSNEIVHDADIAVKVEDGNATTTKNRFKERGMSFDIFPTTNKSYK